MDRVKTGILGCGVISSTYIKNIQELYQPLEIVACADVDTGKAEARAREFGIETWSDPDHLLENKDVSMIINLTPPKFHYELNRRILMAGKNLFCEKPFAFTWEQARELTVLAEERGVRIGGYVFGTGAAADQTAFRAGSHRTAALLKRGDDVLRSGNVASGAGSVLPGRGRAALRYGAILYNCCRGLVWTCCGDQSHGGNRI